MGVVWSQMLRYILFLLWHRWGWHSFCFRAGMGRVWYKHVEMHFLSSVEWDVFGEHMLRYILCRLLVNICLEILRVLAGMGKVCSTQVDMHFRPSLRWKVILRNILCPRWFGMCLVSKSSGTCLVLVGLVKSCDTFCFLAG